MGTYHLDTTWRSMQRFLPQQNQLTQERMPEEYHIPIQDKQIHIDHYRSKTPKGQVILFHGVGGNGRLLSFIALPLQRNGYEVICPDLPLYGYTQYQSNITYQTWVEIGIAIVGHYQQQNDLQTFLFGLSAGGMLAYQVACASTQISGLMVTCILDQRSKEVTKKTVRHPIYATLGKTLLCKTHKLVGSMRVPLKWIVPMQHIANNKALVQLLLQDKKSAGVSVPLAFLYSMITPEISVEPEKFQVCPVLLVHPGKDRWTDPALSQAFYDKLCCEKEMKQLDGAGHFPMEELGLRQMETYCIDFLNAHLS